MGKVIFAGVGNTLAGDDGVGVFMVRELEKRLPDNGIIKFTEIEGDLYQVWDMLPGTDAFVFLDAVTGEIPGMIRKGKTLPRAYSPSFHQADLAAVIVGLETLWDGEFPKWTIWGISINPPEELGEGLTAQVKKGALQAVDAIIGKLTGEGLNIDGFTVRI